MHVTSDNESITTQVLKILDKLPAQAQSLVLAYAEALGLQYETTSPPETPYPLRGTASFDLDPAESAMAADEWHAARGILLSDPD